MTEPKRCIIFIPSDGSTYERMDDPEGHWIFDPDHKIDLRNLTSHSSRAANACADWKSCSNAMAGCIIPCPLYKPPPA